MLRRMLQGMSGKIVSLFLIGFLFCAASASAQSIAYRQQNLASNVVGSADKLDPLLLDPWGMALDPGQSFVIANSNRGRVISLDASGGRTAPPAFSIPNPSGTGPARPTAIVADVDSFFTSQNSFPPLLFSTIIATKDGGIYFWFVNVDGTSLPQATLVSDQSRAGAVYTGLAILTPACCNEFLAAANFHSGSIESFTRRFERLAPPGFFTDPALPAGFAPFGMQVVGNQVFITYALQDAGKQNPVFGLGNGIVSIFDLEGNFVRRFATAGVLNTPWGIAQASANFGPFSNDILIGNLGDGTINAFDPATGNFAGTIKDGDGHALLFSGLHALTFRSDRIGDPNTLYFAAGINGGQDGLFGALTPGLVSTTRVTAPATPAGVPVLITATVSPGPGNSGDPKGMVTLDDSGIAIGEVPITNGMIQFSAVLRGVGIHHIGAQYQGDDIFLPSFSQTDVQVTGPATALTLVAPANAAPGAPVTLTATATSTGATPTGVIVYQDGNTVIGTSALNAAGIATLTINNLAAGAHSLSASYSGDGVFESSVSAPVNTTIAARDFSLGAAPQAVTVAAGQSAPFNITITPTGGFGDPISFSCAPVTGITCNFGQPTVTPNGAIATTMLTVTTSASVQHFGSVPGTGAGRFLKGIGLIGAFGLIVLVGLTGLLASPTKHTPQPRHAISGLAASMAAALLLALTMMSCGYSANSQTYRGTATVQVTAQSGAITHTTPISITVQ